MTIYQSYRYPKGHYCFWMMKFVTGKFVFFYFAQVISLVQGRTGVIVQIL